MTLQEVRELKSKLQGELHNLMNKEYEIEEAARLAKITKDGYYTPLARGKMRRSLYYFDGERFEEEAGYYVVEQILGDPCFKNGHEVVKVKTEDDGNLWLLVEDYPDGDYSGYQDNFYLGERFERYISIYEETN